MGQQYLLILLSVMLHAAHAAGSAAAGPEALVFSAPEDVPIGRNATYCCTTVQDYQVKWRILTPDGDTTGETSLNDIEELETKWKIYFVPHPSNRTSDQLHSITLVAMATEENNNTIITCNEFDNSESFFPSNSKNAKLTVIGPPLSPAPFVEAVNTTFLQISWEEPFAWEGYTVDSYFITIEIASSGDIIDRTLNDTAIIFHRERIAMTCANLVFNVSAESVLGRSEPGTVTSGFPIVPGPIIDATVSIEVDLQGNCPEVTVHFQLPDACDFQTATYTILVWIVTGQDSGVITYGPQQHLYQDGPSVVKVISCDSSEQNLALNKEYAMRIDVITQGGDSASGVHNFSTVLPILKAAMAVPLGKNATYHCATVEGNEVKWSAQTPDGELYDESNLLRIAELETRWNIHIIPHPRDRHFDELHNITLVALATEDNNNTVIICREVEEFRITSKETILTTIGPPLPPSPSNEERPVEAINATALRVAWEEPFIFQGYTIDNYTITVEDASSGAIVIDEIVDVAVNEFVFVRNGGIATTCVSLTVHVTAESVLGRSKPAIFTGGFPIAPSPFENTTVKIDVAFKQNDLTPQVDIEFELPNACDYEIANYTILIWETSRQNETLIFGPKEHFYRNGRSVTREIPSDSSEPDLVIDTEYLMIINVTTPAGSSISGIINFCTYQSSCEQATSDPPSVVNSPGTVAPSVEDSSSLAIGGIVGIAVGTSIGVIIVLFFLFVVPIFTLQWTKKRRVVLNVQTMVDNPIYVGDEEQYENIDGYQTTFISGPPQIQIGPAPYAVTGPPPTLPAPRMVSGKEKDVEHLTEACAKSVDGVSQVSTGEDNYTVMNTAGGTTEDQGKRDDQNIYVKSEC